MSEASALERRYRRLLACYPAGHLRTYGEEMIGVLLASASDGQRRPGIADTIDLIKGAVRVRLRAALAGPPDPGWHDALAVTSLAAPLLLSVLLVGQDLAWMAALLWHSPTGSAGSGNPLWPLAVLLVPLALGLAGLRRTAALATAALIAWIAVQAALGQRLQEPRLAAYLVLLGVQALALATSPGPRRGLRLLTAKSAILALPWLAIVAYAARVIPTHYPVPLVVAETGIGLVALAALPALATPGGRRLLVLLAGIPGSAFVVSLMTVASVSFYSMSLPASQIALYLPPALLASLAAVVIRRSRRPPEPGTASHA